MRRGYASEFAKHSISASLEEAIALVPATAWLISA